MKTVFSSNSECAHVWAQQTQEKGRTNNNINFRGDSIYSYGHWKMARFVVYNVVFMRDWSYSITTSKHMSHVRHAISGGNNIFYCNNPDMSPTDIMKQYEQDLKELESKFKSDKSNKSYYLDSIINLCKKSAELSELFGIDNKLKDYNVNILTNETEEYLKKAQESRDKRNKQYRETLDAWLTEIKTKLPENASEFILESWRQHDPIDAFKIPDNIISTVGND